MKYTTEIQKAQFDESGFAIIAGWIEVYLCDSMTREYIGASFDNVPTGLSVVADAYLDKPEIPSEPDIAIIRSEDGKSWLHIEDHRGKVAYKTESRQPIVIDFIGSLPETLTLLEPQTTFDVWNGKKWVTDTESQQASFIAQAEHEKAQRLEEAEQHIAMLERKVRLNMATDEDKELLKQWEIYSINTSNIDTSLAPDIDWSQKP
ncbi:MAG: tail fiber assembly protein [Providencia sp.]|uniref:tail fiber assembly protein n=1 Tax=Providencia sp. TaxID=589 RepID=UPI003F9E8E36